tara:strand:- start:247 stop:1386 length:1140 start_codon:yes stop_codon:yes gene_type:complete
MVQKLRIFSLIFIHILILLHIFYWGDQVVGSVDFQEFFHSFLKHGVINAGVLLVLIAFIITLIFGRFFCGWACHFGAVQELSWFILKKMNIKPKTIDSKLVTFLPLLILVHLYIIPNLFFANNSSWNISIKLNEHSIWAFLPGIVIGSLTFIIDGFLIIYFLGRKGFCRFICPWGAFLKLPNSLALFKVRKTGTCTNCHACNDSCPIGIDVNYEINKHKKVTNTNCTSCMLCISGCPSNALSYAYQNPLKEEISLSHYMPAKNKINDLIKKKNHFESIRNQDWIYLLLIFLFANSIDGLYGIGHFLAYGIAIIAAFIIINNKMHTLLIKYALTSIIILLFAFHGIIKINIYLGNQYYNNKDSTFLQRTIQDYAQKMGKY